MQRTFNDPNKRNTWPFFEFDSEEVIFNLHKVYAQEAIVRENPKPIRALPPAEYAKQPTKVNPDMAKRDGCGPEYEMEKCYIEGWRGWYK